MAQDPRTANDLILNAFYQLGELAVGEPADGFMKQTGLFLINQLLDSFSCAQVYVPFETNVDFLMETGKDSYTISNIVIPDIFGNRLVSLDYANYTYQSIVYPLQITNKSQYYNLVRLNNIQARPVTIFLDKQIRESIVTVYPIPDQIYPTTLRGKVMIDSLQYNTIIDQVPPYYQSFLQMALTRRLKSYYPSGNWSAEDEQEYTRMFDDLKSSNELDMTIRTSGILTRERDTYYWQNILSY